jgi:hypothetical protein
MGHSLSTRNHWRERGVITSSTHGQIGLICLQPNGIFLLFLSWLPLLTWMSEAEQGTHFGYAPNCREKLTAASSDIKPET